MNVDENTGNRVMRLGYHIQLNLAQNLTLSNHNLDFGHLV